jgi:hypothetical protein
MHDKMYDYHYAIPMSVASLLFTSAGVGRPSLAPILLSLAAATDVPSFMQMSSDQPCDHPVINPPIKASPVRENAVQDG